jgi:serine/threonine protein kinase
LDVSALKHLTLCHYPNHTSIQKDRDVKLQNVLFPLNSSDPRKIKIVDFGLSVILEGNQSTRDFCGSLGYIAPEIYQRKPYRYEVDMFAFGVLLFRLLSGERPFPSNNQDVLQRHTVELRYNVQGRDWRTVSDSAKDLIRRLLINRQERWTADECLKHEWFSSSGESLLRPDLSIIGDRSDGESRSRAFVKVRTWQNLFITLTQSRVLTMYCCYFILPSISVVGTDRNTNHNRRK